MIDLVIGNSDNVIDNASIPVRWCLSDDLIETVNNSDSKPKIVIVVTYEQGLYDRKEERYVFDLNQVMAYIPLSKAGNVTITAYFFLVQTEAKKFTELVLEKDKYNRTKYEFKMNKLNNWDSYLSLMYKHIESSIDYNYEVPDSVFGKLPPPTILKLINRYQNNTIIDECDLRRRYLIFPFKLLIILLEILIRQSSKLFVYAISICLGYTVNFKYLKYPLMFSGINVISNDPFVCKSWNILDFEFINNTKPKHLVLLQTIVYAPLILLKIPIILVCLFLLGMNYINDIPNLTIYSYYSLLAVSPIVLIYILEVIIGLTAAISYCLVRLIEKRFNKVMILAMVSIMGILITNNELRLVIYLIFSLLVVELILAIVNITPFKYFKSKLKRKTNVKKTNIELLTCCDSNKTTNIPYKHKSIKLIYNETKNKICKPLQR